MCPDILILNYVAWIDLVIKQFIANNDVSTLISNLEIIIESLKTCI